MHEWLHINSGCSTCNVFSADRLKSGTRLHLVTMRSQLCLNKHSTLNKSEDSANKNNNTYNIKKHHFPSLIRGSITDPCVYHWSVFPSLIRVSITDPCVHHWSVCYILNALENKLALLTLLQSEYHKCFYSIFKLRQFENTDFRDCTNVFLVWLDAYWSLNQHSNTYFIRHSSAISYIPYFHLRTTLISFIPTRSRNCVQQNKSSIKIWLNNVLSCTRFIKQIYITCTLM